MSISAQDVNKLRQMTGSGMMDCKKALTEANGDFDTAIELLRKKGQKVSAARANRETSEGIVLAQTNDTATQGVLMTLTCETDFVAKNKAFIELGKRIIEMVLSNDITDTPALERMPIDGVTVADKVIELTGKMGEKIEIKDLQILTGEIVVPYVHSNANLGVLVALKNIDISVQLEAVGKDVAMQIAAMNPIAVDKDGIDAVIVEKEIEIGKEQAREEGKPENIIEKIALGKLNKFYQENTLLSQSFVKDSTINVAQYLDNTSKGLTVSGFKRISIS